MKFVGLIKHEQKHIKSGRSEHWEEKIESSSLITVLAQVKQWHEEAKQPYRKGYIHTYCTHVRIKQ